MQLRKALLLAWLSVNRQDTDYWDLGTWERLYRRQTQ